MILFIFIIYLLPLTLTSTSLTSSTSIPPSIPSSSSSSSSSDSLTQNITTSTSSSTSSITSTTISLLPNWDVYENLIDDINITQSLLYIQNIPLHTYWDIYKGGYKLGIIAERLIEKYPELITYSLIKNSTKPPISLVNITTIDTNTLFMHVLVVIKYISMKLSNISNNIEFINLNTHESNLKLSKLINITENKWKSVAQLKHEIKLKEIKIEYLKKRIEYIKQRTIQRVDNIQEYYKNKTKLLEDFHNYSIMMRDKSEHNISKLEEEIRERKTKQLQETEEERLLSQIQLLNVTYQQELEKIQQEINMSITVMYFRAEAESRAAHENEDVNRNILIAQAEHMRRNFEEILTIVKSQLLNALDLVLSQPLVVLKYSLMISLSIFLFIFSTEIYMIFKLLLLRLFTPPLVIRQAKRNSPNLPNSSLVLPSKSSIKSSSHIEEQKLSIDQMIVSPITRKKLFHIAQILVARQTTLQGYKSFISLEKSIKNKSSSSSSSQFLSLPNILIIGPPGTGKSFAATSLASHSGLPYLSLCAGDILATSPTLSSPSVNSTSSQSGGPGGLLRDVLESASKANNKKGFLVILDDADMLITNRKRTSKLENNDISSLNQNEIEINERKETSNDCIHILLHRLRINTPLLGTFITTSMNINQIDPAILDRMDHIIHLDLPNSYLRLETILHFTSLYLTPYLDTTQQSILQNLYEIHTKLTINQTTQEIINFLEETFQIKIFDKLLNQQSNESFSTKSPSKKNESNKNVINSSSLSTVSSKKKSKKVTSSINTQDEQQIETLTQNEEKIQEENQKQQEMDNEIEIESSEFELVLCFGLSLQSSDGWTYREIEKFIQSILSLVLSTEKCILTTNIWLTQLKYKKESYNQKKSSSSSSSESNVNNNKKNEKIEKECKNDELN